MKKHPKVQSAEPKLSGIFKNRPVYGMFSRHASGKWKCCPAAKGFDDRYSAVLSVAPSEWVRDEGLWSSKVADS